MDIDPYELGLAIAGTAALIAAWLPGFLARRPLSLPIILVIVGASIFALPTALGAPDPRDHLPLAERMTELGVVVALMGAGIKIDRPFSWRRWTTTWRMLVIAMPVTILLTATLGAVVAGIAASSALLLGAVLAPTDPVLASDVQVGEPTLDEPAGPHSATTLDPYGEDEVRFTLTSEGGLNDALAFPFVYAAIAVTEHGGDPGQWIPTWLAWDLIGRVLIAVAVGWLIGRLIGVVAFRPPGPLTPLAETPQGFLAIAATLMAYGVTEVLSGYGFLAVFVAAVVLRGTERHHEFHAALHSFTEQTENLLVVGLLLLFGGTLIAGILGGLTWQGALVAVLVVSVVRPLSGQIALAGAGLPRRERWAIAFFGIRGLGSIYYLAYGLGHASFADGDLLWAIVSLTLVVSIATHGITATPVMSIIDRARRRSSRVRPAGPS